MTFQIVGDDVFYEGTKVAVLDCDQFPTLRDHIWHTLTEWDGSDVVDLTDDLAAAEHDRDEAEHDRDAMERQRDAMGRQRNEARATADAYATLLMIEPEQWDE